jgi:cell division protein FtsN
MKIDKYIEALLFDHECVIVPGLGGFIINNRHAAIDQLSHQFYPPHKKILFNQYIRFNDGLLVNFISKKENLSFETIRKQIDELVQQYYAKLENGGKIIFENIGVISFDQNKNITFDQFGTLNFNSESFGLERLVSPPIKRKKETEPVKGILQVQPKPPKPEDRKPEPVKARDLKPMHKRRNKSQSENILSIAAIALLTILLVSALLTYFNSEPVRDFIQSYAESLTEKKEKSHYTPRPEQNIETKNIVANKAGFLSLTTFEIEETSDENIPESTPEEIHFENKYIAGVISVADYFNYRGRNFSANNDETVAETEISESENIVTGNVEMPEAAPVVKEEIVVEIKTSSQYYIIAGSFSEEQNARNLIDELLKKGFSTQIIDTNKFGMYRVAYLGLKNLNEAKQKLFAIREEEDNPGAWILKK